MTCDNSCRDRVLDKRTGELVLTNVRRWPLEKPCCLQALLAMWPGKQAGILEVCRAHGIDPQEALDGLRSAEQTQASTTPPPAPQKRPERPGNARARGNESWRGSL